MKCKHLTLLLLFASIISQDYHVRCPDLNNVLSRASIPSLDTFYITVDSTFMIHYDTTNIDNNELYDMSDNNNNHTPRNNNIPINNSLITRTPEILISIATVFKRCVCLPQIIKEYL